MECLWIPSSLPSKKSRHNNHSHNTCYSHRENYIIKRHTPYPSTLHPLHLVLRQLHHFWQQLLRNAETCIRKIASTVQPNKKCGYHTSATPHPSTRRELHVENNEENNWIQHKEEVAQNGKTVNVNVQQRRVEQDIGPSIRKKAHVTAFVPLRSIWDTWRRDRKQKLTTEERNSKSFQTLQNHGLNVSETRVAPSTQKRTLSDSNNQIRIIAIVDDQNPSP